MDNADKLAQGIQAKINECRIAAAAYASTLSALIPANFILVVGAALLSLVAGATILTKTEILSSDHAGILALISAGLTIIHSKLGCEQYQAECRKLASLYRGLAEDYANLQFIADEAERRKKVVALNEQLSAAIKSASAVPFNWALAGARKSMR